MTRAGFEDRPISQPPVKPTVKPVPSPASKATVPDAPAQPLPEQPAPTRPAQPKPAPPKPAGPARIRKRHSGIMLGFVFVVIVPLAAIAWYLFWVANDQYVSKVGFAVRSEQVTSASDLLGGLAGISGASSSDTDILYEFMQSQELVERISQRVPLIEYWSRPEFDPYFAFRPSGQIEDLVQYWQRMVRIHYDQGTALIELHVHAFRPQEAQQIAQLIVDESTRMINALAATAREDATRNAREELDTALERLKSAREALTKFRSDNRIVDPTADLAGQMGLLNSLEAQLAEAQIELNLVRQTARDNDPRIGQAERRIDVIEELIERERAKFGIGTGDVSAALGGRAYSTLVGEFERLTVDREYAEETYLRAQATLDAAIATAQRQSRYLATYNEPTLPQSSRYPERFTLVLIVGAFLFLIWCVGMLVYYSIRDRR